MAPTLRQLYFLSLPHREAFYGGAAGGGKSEALLMGALMFVDLPGYAAILFRRTFTDLSLDGALMDRADDWLAGKGARWNERDKRWEFPSGSTLTFGYLDRPRDWRRYDSAEFQYIGFDEATQFRAKDYNALIGRLRRKAASPIPLRVRAASNPGDESHEFFGDRFVNPREPSEERIFVPALMEDNPHLDREEYERTLAALAEADPVLYRQRRFGEWVRDEGEAIFRREWWDDARYRFGDRGYHGSVKRRFQFWDTALEDDDAASYTACVTLDLLADYRIAVREVWRKKMQFPDLESSIVRKATEHNQDGLLSGILLEKKASAHSVLQTLKVNAPAWVRRLIGPFTPPGSKDEKNRRAAMYCAPGLVLLPHAGHEYAGPDGPWLMDFAEELWVVPNAKYRDMTDAFSLGVIRLERYLAEAYRSLQEAA